MIKTKLQMTFKNADDKKTNISVDNPKEDLEPSQIKGVMDGIIEKNIFHSNGVDLVDVIGAKFITTEVEEIEF